MVYEECATCAKKLTLEDTVECIDCSKKKHARCAKMDIKEVGKRHWRCRSCSRMKSRERRARSADTSKPLSKGSHRGAGDSLGKKKKKHKSQHNFDLLNKLRDEFDKSVAKLKQLEDTVVHLEDRCHELASTNEKFQKDDAVYKLKVEDLEQKLRKNTVDVWGVTVSDRDDVLDLVLRLFNAMDWKRGVDSIESVGTSRKSDFDFEVGARLCKVDPFTPRTVMWINFLSNRDKDDFLTKWKTIEQSGGLTLKHIGLIGERRIKVEQSLTSYKLQLFQAAVDNAIENKFQRVGVKDGEVFILKDSKGPVFFVKTCQDLERLTESQKKERNDA